MGGESPRVGRKRPVAPLDESLAKGFKRARPLQADSTHLPARVTNIAEEMASNFINLYDDDLIDDIYLVGEKDVAAECDALRASQSNINPEGVCLPGCCYPPGLPEVSPENVAAPLRDCAGRWAAISVDTSDMDPTQMAAYNFVTSWAENAGRVDKANGELPTPLKLTLLGTAGAGKTRVISSIVQRCRDIFGSRQSVVVAAHTGVAASNVGCGGRTLAGLFRTMGETIDELKENNCATLRAN